MSLINDELITKPEPLLLSVVGGSPQVITETLFGILKAKQEIPKHIKVITTTFGLKSMDDLGMFEVNGPLSQFAEHFDVKIPSLSLSDRILALLNEQRANNLEKSKTKELKKGEKTETLKRSELNKADEEDGDIWVIESEGNFLLDARTVEEHTAFADFITEKVRLLTNCEVTKDEDELPTLHDTIDIKKTIETLNQYNPYFKEVKISGTKNPVAKIIYHKYAIHASIAGGRKSMTFYLGYLMSIFGRPFDKLSHVLITEELEYKREFLFPTNTNDEADVSLAEIKILPLGKSIPKAFKNIKTSYSNIIDSAELGQKEPNIQIYLDHYRIKEGKNRGWNKFKVKFNGHVVYLKTKSILFLLSSIELNKRGMKAKSEMEMPLVMLQSCLCLLTGKYLESTYSNNYDIESPLNEERVTLEELNKLENNHDLQSDYALSLADECKNAILSGTQIDNFQSVINKIDEKLEIVSKENKKNKENYETALKKYKDEKAINITQGIKNSNKLQVAKTTLEQQAENLKSEVFNKLGTAFALTNSYDGAKNALSDVLKSYFSTEVAKKYLPNKQGYLNIEIDNIEIIDRNSDEVITINSD